jgi:GAF domain-containing protein
MATVVLLANSLLLGAFFAVLYRQKQQLYLLAWSAGWLAFTLQLSVSLVARYPVSSAVWLYALDEWLLALSGLVFLGAARLYAGSTPAIRELAVAASVAAVWSVAYARGYLAIPVELGVALIFLLVARVFWVSGRKRESVADRVLGITFAAWSLLCLARAWPRFAASGGRAVSLVIFVPLLFAGLLVVMAVYEEERRRVERNMLALSNLNLATSGFVGGEIQKMLAQALDRVLNVVRVPAGALCLHYGVSDGPTSVVVTGLSDTFCSTVQEDNLDEYFVGLVARLGGLVTLRNLPSDSEYVALDKEESFRRVRQLLLREGLRSVVAVSLQAKERVFGVLLLGTFDHRTFTPAELRLLLGLGHQIGMAVENSYLVQQTARRSEELHVLNEVGRALSSTLDLDSLL